jgi:hypothetical protein
LLPVLFLVKRHARVRQLPLHRIDLALQLGAPLFQHAQIDRLGLRCY